MYLGLPILTFDVSYNRTTTENKAFYFKNAQDIVQIIENTRLSELRIRSAQMKEVADRRYTWSVIAQKYGFLVKSVLVNKKKISVKPAVSDISNSSLLELGVAHLQSPSLFYEKR